MIGLAKFNRVHLLYRTTCQLQIVCLFCLTKMKAHLYLVAVYLFHEAAGRLQLEAETLVQQRMPHRTDDGLTELPAIIRELMSDGLGTFGGRCAS